jgi:ribosomal protein S18 acetylase RimI-like enzyme
LIILVPITPERAQIFKSVRLRALQDSPSAFGSTWARESQLTDEEWITRSRRWNGDRACGFIAMDQRLGREDDPEAACGLVCSFLDEQDSTRAHLISMWTAPTHRRSGLGWRLVDGVMSWAHSRGANALVLLVTSSNHAAIAFYERLGFKRTGRTEPYPNDPKVVEYEMVKGLEDSH